MDKINFTINGKHYSITGLDVSPDTSLSDFLRYHVSLCGTKTMCQEGGCGACSVSVARTHPLTKDRQVFTVNSCLVHILSCHDWDITTIEGVGNRRDGYHVIQSRLAMFNGTQCGYCTPGWIMNMYSLQNNETELSAKQIESSFGGNMCRCTGYRPILDAFKSFAVDVDQQLQQKLVDLEDLNLIKCVSKINKSECSRFRNGLDKDNREEQRFSVDLQGGRWYKTYKVDDVFTIMKKEGSNEHCFVNGNTGKGVYPTISHRKLHIDISSISALKESYVDGNLVLGAGMTLSELMDVFSKNKMADFHYLSVLHDYLDLVAHVPIRNLGTIGGNLAMKNQHKEFPSDIFNFLTTVEATVTLMDKTLTKKVHKMEEFLNADLKDHLIYDVQLPPLNSEDLLRMYKIMPRSQNAHAIQNAGFLFKLDKDSKVSSCTISYGSISPTFTRAIETETVLKGQSLFDEKTLQMSLSKLNEELRPTEAAPDASPYCRKMIALGLFYKAILDLASPVLVSPRYKSGGNMLERPLSKGTQSFQTDKNLWPLNQPMPKLEALAQCSGEVKYSDDVDASSKDVHVAFVLSTVCRGEIDHIDTEEILKTAGVIAVYTAKDIPGSNSFRPISMVFHTNDEEILASSKISYYGQPVALVAASTRKQALRAAAQLKVQYKNEVKNNVLTIEEAMVAEDKEDRIRQDIIIEAKERGTDVTKVIKGRFTVPSQYHYYMEPQTCRAEATEFGIEVNVSTQWVDLVQVAVAQMLDIKENEVSVTVRRVGGAYGGKASGAALVACTASLVASKVSGPVRVVLPMRHSTGALGMRQRCLADYEIEVNDEGVIQYLELSLYADCGYSFNDSAVGPAVATITDMYESSRWKVQGYNVRTDKASNTYCRAPGTAEGTAIVEHIMERIAFITNKDTTEIKRLNLPTEHPIKEIITAFIADTEYQQRKADIQNFNSLNAWKKKALNISLMSYPIMYFGNMSVVITIYHADGSVDIAHGGIEMGQGINTKVAQVCAHKFKIPLSKVAVKATSSFVSPNSAPSGGSIASDSVAFATVKACDILLERFKGVENELVEPTWEAIVNKAYEKGVDLQASYMKSDNDNIEWYSVHGLVASEVTLDVLTGCHQVTRVDLLEDTGQSISPDVDVGQIEGAFVMGLGLWTSECLKYDGSTGMLLTDRTWNYKPPGAKDIPVDFRISFKRNSYNKAGVLRSKGSFLVDHYGPMFTSGSPTADMMISKKVTTGEPALVLAVSVALAIHETIHEARKEFGYAHEWIDVETPFSVENIIRAISPKIESFKINV